MKQVQMEASGAALTTIKLSIHPVEVMALMQDVLLRWRSIQQTGQRQCNAVRAALPQHT